MRRFALALALWATCWTSGLAAITDVQDKDCTAISGSGTCALTSAPTNANVLLAAIMDAVAADCANIGWKDSNNTALTQRVCASPASGVSADFHTYTIVSSPTATYTNTDTSVVIVGMSELAGVNATSIQTQSASSLSTASLATPAITTIANGGVLFCVARGTTITLSSSVGTLTVLSTNGNAKSGYALLASGASNATCTVTQTAAAASIAALSYDPPAATTNPALYWGGWMGLFSELKPV